MLIAVMLVSAAASIVFPSMASAWRQLAVQTAMDQLISAHQKTRTAAVRYGRVAELHVDTANSIFWVQMDTSLASSGVMDTVGAVVDLTENMVTISATVSVLCFDARGMVAVVSGCPASGAGTFTLTRDDSSETFITTSGGVPWEIG